MILTIPNLISALRIGAVPVFLWLLLGLDNPAAAGWLLGGLGATDWVDGWLARRLNQVSELGKILDPVGDRLAIAAALVGGWIAGAVPWGIALALIIRESVVASGALVAAARARATIEVRRMGKAATLGVYVAVANFIIHAGTDHVFFIAVAWTFIIPGLILYYAVAVQYFGDVRRILARRRTVSSDRSDEEESRVEVPQELRYTEDHEWVRAEDGRLRVGITDYAQDALGDVVFVDLPEVGSHFESGAAMAEVESTKSVAEVYAPLTGTVTEINQALAEAPELVNGDPYGDGWFVLMDPDDPAAFDGLLNAAAYEELIG